jgi:hypothetical protein
MKPLYKLYPPIALKDGRVLLTLGVVYAGDA